MELNITQFIENEYMENYSASIAELGENAGQITWNNAKEYAENNPMLKTDEEIAEFKQYVVGFGAWDDDEIEAWNDIETNALLVQMIAGDHRNDSDSIYIEDNGQYWFYIGN